MPGKAAYKALEADPELEFTYYLADRLKMTVARLTAEMPAAEFGLWQAYHARRAQEIELAQKKG